MRQVILDFPKQFETGLRAAKNIKVEGEFGNIVVSGMGGSAWPTDILTTWLTPPIPIYVNRTYSLPLQTTSKTLAIFSSYSGNTEECVYSYQEAIQKGIPCIAITSGGRLRELCQENNTPMAIIPAGFQPRMATGYLFSALYSVLVNSKIMKDKSDEILEMASNLKPQHSEDEGRNIAKKLFKKIPIIYTSDRFKSIGYVWKIKFNESSKSPAFSNFFSELNHNEMTGFTNPGAKFQVIILRDLQDYPKILKRMKITAELMKSKGINVEIINMPRVNPLSQIFSTIMLGDWASYYLALMYKVDPTPIKMQEEFKERMKS